MRARSRQVEAAYRERRPLVAAILAERPRCELCGAGRSTDVHEVQSRARGGSILDEANLVALDHICHSWITEHPTWAQAHGWALPSWAGPAEVDAAARARATLTCTGACQVDHISGRAAS